MSSENREYVPSCLYPFAVLASQCCQRPGFAEAANDARLRGKWPASMETQTKDEHQAAVRERGANSVSTNGRNGPPRTEGRAPKLKTLTSTCTGTKDGRRAAETDMSSKPRFPRTDPFPTRFLLRAVWGDCTMIGPTIATETFRIYPQHVLCTRTTTRQCEGEKCCPRTNGREMKEWYSL